MLHVRPHSIWGHLLFPNGHQSDAGRKLSRWSNVALRLNNAAPELMEVNVVDVEDAVMGIEGLKQVSSTASQGIANITCEFVLSYNVDVALQEVQNRIGQVQNLLPTALYPPVITKTNPEDQPIMWVMVTADENVPPAGKPQLPSRATGGISGGDGGIGRGAGAKIRDGAVREMPGKAKKKK